MNLLTRLVLFLLLAMPLTVILTNNLSVRAEDAVEEDAVEGEEDDDDEATVESDEAVPDLGGDVTEGEAEETSTPEVTSSPHAKTSILFVRPVKTSDLAAGQPVSFLVGFENAGEGDFVIDTMEASFRYPQDFSYHIQNFTQYRYERVVEPSRQATLHYIFTPHEAFQGRPFGLVVMLNYHDDIGQHFSEAVFNETITVVEPEVGLDGEAFFMYIMLAAVGVLLLIGVQQLLSGVAKKRSSAPKPAVEMGTQNKGDVDFDWLPKEHVQKLSPRVSPGRRRAKRGADAE